MRTIKFRGRRLDSGTWIYGSLFNSIWRKSADGSRVCYIFPDNMLDDDDGGGDCWEDFAAVAEQYEVDPATVGQYTGLKDRNGKEIYEGDILAVSFRKHSDLRRLVEYVWGEFILRYSKGRGYLRLSEFDPSNLHVIGNIHDNPELLKTE